MSHNWIDAIAQTSRVAPFQLFVVAVCVRCFIVSRQI
jgi:hypothetical protein